MTVEELIEELRDMDQAMEVQASAMTADLEILGVEEVDGVVLLNLGREVEA